MYLIYKTDNHHRYASRDLIAVATKLKNVLPLIRQAAQKQGVPLDEDDEHCLQNYRQTQGYRGDGEFDYEEIDKLDQLL